MQCCMVRDDQAMAVVPLEPTEFCLILLRLKNFGIHFSCQQKGCKNLYNDVRIAARRQHGECQPTPTLGIF